MPIHVQLLETHRNATQSIHQRHIIPLDLLQPRVHFLLLKADIAPRSALLPVTVEEAAAQADFRGSVLHLLLACRDCFAIRTEEGGRDGAGMRWGAWGSGVEFVWDVERFGGIERVAC